MEAMHRFRNNASAIPYGNRSFDDAYDAGIIDIQVRRNGDGLETLDGHRFVNFASCAYLGLQNHPAVVQGAADAVRREGFIEIPTSRVRIRPILMEELEAGLSEHYRARVVCSLSASVASMGVLPLIASGHLERGEAKPRVMVFDKFCHFSMNLVKPICADETRVLTAPHDDLDYLEDVCKKNSRVAFITDGAHSLGGGARVRELFELQDRYGLFIFFDDSHSLSIWGERGEGYVRSTVPELNPLTLIVASLAKGFGAGGGVIMMGPEMQEAILARFGGPLAWSQSLNMPTCGAALASLEIHRSPELGRLQQQLRDHLALFDEHMPSPQKGDVFPVRVVEVGEEEAAVACSKKILERGFYSSAVFFPIVKKKHAGLRALIRADHRPQDIVALCEALREVLEDG